MPRNLSSFIVFDNEYCNALSDTLQDIFWLPEYFSGPVATTALYWW